MGCCQSVDQALDKPSKSYPKFFETIPSLQGKIVAITGTTTGTGNVAARTCAQKGATVILLNRPSDRAVKSLKALQEAAPGATFVSVDCDLMSVESVKRAAAEVKKKFGMSGIDVLCCNAGIMATPDEATKDGFDTQMQTNHLSHWLLSAELWPLLALAGARTGDARLVFHSSSARKALVKKLEAKYMQRNGGKLGGDSTSLFGGRWKRYMHTKLANIVCAYALADRCDAAGVKGVKVLVAEPGLAATSLQLNSGKSGGMSDGMTAFSFSVAGHSGEDGTCPLLSCMVSPDAKNGDFYLPKGGLSGPPVKMAKREKHCNDAENKKILTDATVESMGCDIPIEATQGNR